MINPYGEIVQVAGEGSNERSITHKGYNGRGNEYQTRGQDVSPWARRFATVMMEAEKGGRT